MRRREDWTFQYQAETVRTAAQQKVGQHQERLDFWTLERDKAEAELREKGLEFREHDMTGGRQVQAVLDPERQAHLNRCTNKIDSHKRELADYELWVRALGTKRGVLELTLDDIRFFEL